MAFSNNFKINKNKIGFDYPTYFIADIAANHDGDLNRAVDLIYLAAEAGANAAKFQHFQANTIVSDFGFKSLNNSLLSHQSKWKKSVYDTYNEAEINLNWTDKLVEACKKANIDFFTSPYSLELVDYIDKYVSAYKIGSGDITWIEIIEYIANKNKPVIIACGASDLTDIDRAISSISNLNSDVALLQCNTNYTASLENFKFINLNVIDYLKNRYPDLILGLSDHTPGHVTVLGAIAKGAKIIEKHFTDDNERNGPDHKFSMTPKTWKEMILRSRELEASLGDGNKKIEKNEIETSVLQRRSICVKENSNMGKIIELNDIVFLRPCPKDGIQPFEFKNVLGKKLINKKTKGEYIKWTDLE